MLTAMLAAGQIRGAYMQLAELDTLSQNAKFFQSKRGVAGGIKPECQMTQTAGRQYETEKKEYLG